jgi:hypothetical protein
MPLDNLSFRRGNGLNASELQAIVQGVNASSVNREYSHAVQFVKLITNCDIGATCLVQGGYYSGTDFVNTNYPQFSSINIGSTLGRTGDIVQLLFTDACLNIPAFTHHGNFLVTLQANINANASGNVKLAYYNGSWATVGDNFTAFNIGPGNASNGNHKVCWSKGVGTVTSYPFFDT